VHLALGIDPGKNGGVAWLPADGKGKAEAAKMPGTETDVFQLLQTIGGSGDVFAVLEKVHSSPQMGVRSAFTFGMNKGGLRMALAAAEIPYEEVSPLKWQTEMGCRTAGDKNVSKQRAQSLFPYLKVTHAIADSLLIAEYCRRVFGGR
tara:strand:+ start:32581 stop:33024 length:444 start_codon:yes stop_codon:yes gene_type:complete